MPKDDPHIISIIFFDPIIQILNNDNKTKQIGASIVLKALIDHIGKSKHLSFIVDNLSSGIFDAILRSTSDSPELIDLFTKLIKNIRSSSIIDNLNKILKFINCILKPESHHIVTL